MRDVVRLVVRRMRLSAPLSSSPLFRLFVEFSIWPFPGANQKSSSHFHCLKCDYYCTDTNKVSRHMDWVHMDLKRHMELLHKAVPNCGPAGGGAQEAAPETGQHHGSR